jgi:hypothetical protein
LKKINVRRDCFLKQCKKGKIEGTEIRGIRGTQLVDDVKKTELSGILIRKYYIVICGELAFAEVMNLSEDTVRTE